ncbi:uncharacterized protein LACBIDRAFT_307865 [Laccaria bicolor S238N-H82]|uniref:Predicted protein n=1 Tax=Laccaria bicolor (strain S238N-H82 / ATCC MYA-4686) TaxID=486041 RepID=B0DQW2_LACBS|nr:uncharacterized protein LACBIDRAFT_307865 [Laccaria bicolor S238N-H82]EDR02956.1 predicted protein [Laccaria bicolor S238N-H82]|eukprot:XP_001886379.1 predicted protein [Laccaria bicolor S238N-H82]
MLSAQASGVTAPSISVCLWRCLKVCTSCRNPCSLDLPLILSFPLPLQPPSPPRLFHTLRRRSNNGTKHSLPRHTRPCQSTVTPSSTS